MIGLYSRQVDPKGNQVHVFTCQLLKLYSVDLQTKVFNYFTIGLLVIFTFATEFPYMNLIGQTSFKPFQSLEIFIKLSHINYMSRDMTKPTKWLCAQPALRSAWASAKSDRSLRCVLKVRTQGFFMRTGKTLIRLGRCPGWSESSLGAHSFWWFCHVAAHM